jgi:spermidine synthase
MDIYPSKTDVLVFETRSRLQEIKVFDKLNGLRYLILNGVQHGGHIPGQPGRLVLPYFKSSVAALAFLDRPRSYLFVGLGMGAVPSYMWTVQQDADIDVIEIDPEVTDTAVNWFGLRPTDNLRVTNGDGREFINTTDKKYDAVFLDAYKDLSVPNHLTTVEFMREVRGVLKPGGVAVSNLWGSVVNPLFDRCVRTLQEAFTELYQFKSYTYNYIFVCDTKENEIPPHELLRRAKKTDDKYNLGFSLVQMVRKNYSHLEKDAFGRAEVITDNT